MSALATEIRRSANGAKVDTIYFGGGTPSLLSRSEMAELLVACRSAYEVDPDAEISLEANPETVERSWLDGWLEAGVTRLSFGVQSFRDDELQRLGRRHTAQRAKEAIQLAQESGVDDISLDLMLCLPSQTRIHWQESVEALIDLGPTHASLYLLELYPNAPLKDEMNRAGWSLAADEDAAEMYLEALTRTDEAGYEQYEISNISRPSHHCRHNLKYWQGGEWIGFGCGSHSTHRSHRWRNINSTERYIDCVMQHRSVVAEWHELTDDERLGDHLFMGLRLTEGIDLHAVEQGHGVDVMDRYGSALAPFLDSRLLRLESGRLSLSRRGMLVANEVMMLFV